MKSTHVKNETEKIEFPCLMIHEVMETVILVTEKTDLGYTGIVLSSPNEPFEIGYTSKTFVLDYHPLPKGEQIILEN